MNKNKRFSTNAIHVGNEPNFKEGGSGDVVVPLHLSTTFARKKVNVPTAGYEYSRSGNPTRDALEKNLAALEHAQYAFAFSSGLAATTTLILSLKSGDHVLSIDDVYGGTQRLFRKIFAQFGIETTYIDFTEGKDIEKYIKQNTKLLWIETPTNPLLKIVDIASVTKTAKEHNVLSVVDNTFATPYFQQPLRLGADIVIHSMTKYIGGHSDSVAGAIMTNNSQVADKIKFIQNAAGAILSPFDSYQILKGIKTLALRMQRHEENAKKIVEYLQKHPKVKKIYYPGLENHPGHEIAKKQMSGFGGMVSFELDGTIETGITFLESLNIISIAESLGAVESLIEHPASMTHASVPKEHREQIGLSDTLIRLSVGVEDVEDVIEDIDQALATI